MTSWRRWLRVGTCWQELTGQMHRYVHCAAASYNLYSRGAGDQYKSHSGMFRCGYLLQRGLPGQIHRNTYGRYSLLSISPCPSPRQKSFSGIHFYFHRCRKFSYNHGLIVAGRNSPKTWSTSAQTKTEATGTGSRQQKESDVEPWGGSSKGCS